MNPEQRDLRIERVENGWVVTGWTVQYARGEGYMPATHVATSPDQLAALIHAWASAQAVRPVDPS